MLVAGLESVASSKRAIQDPASILANEGETPKSAPAMSETQTPTTTDKKPSEPKAFTEVRFIKNIHPGEIITFKDKTTFRFPSPLFICKDEKLANKILEVADQHNIVIQ